MIITPAAAAAADRSGWKIETLGALSFPPVTPRPAHSWRVVVKAGCRLVVV